MTDTSTLCEAANVPQTVSAIRIALDTSNQQIDPAQQYVTIEDCLAYGKRILDAQTEQSDRFMDFAFRVIYQVSHCLEVGGNDLMGAILHMPKDLQEALEIPPSHPEQPDLQLPAPKVEGDAPDQTGVSSAPSAAPTDNTAELVELRSLIEGYKEWAADVKRLTRALDVELHGDQAAPQASLCDLIGSVKEFRERHASAVEALIELLHVYEKGGAYSDQYSRKARAALASRAPAPDAVGDRPLPHIRFGVHSRPINPNDDR